MEPGELATIFIFNPFAEGYIAHGTAFTPVKHQEMLASDLANLPQFLCEPHDVVLLEKTPSAAFLDSLKQAGFSLPEFIEIREGRIEVAGNFSQKKIGALRPWAWGPDSARLLEPLFARVAGETAGAKRYFNDRVERLYSKAWSASFLREILAHCREWDEEGQASLSGTEAQIQADAPAVRAWFCSPQEAGIAVDNVKDALRAVAAIRKRGHHRVVVKEAHGLAGHNAIRLWEPEFLPAQQRWLAHALNNGRPVVVEPWLERELDFSVQLEMGQRKLQLCGYTGLVNDIKGQFLANWAEPNCSHRLSARVTELLDSAGDISARLERLYSRIFSLLETELQRIGFVGPVSIDAFVYRTPEGDCRLKPVVEVNPRYTMGRLTLELMKHTAPGTSGIFRLVNRAQARAKGFADLAGYASSLLKRFPLQLELEDRACVSLGEFTGPHARRFGSKIRQGALCLNDPAEAKVCLATFEACRPSRPIGRDGTRWGY